MMGATAGITIGGGGGGTTAGYATQAWVDENYLSIEFFSSLFKAYDSASTPNEIVPNGGDTSAITTPPPSTTSRPCSASGLNST